jgi:hypothetical protein
MAAPQARAPAQSTAGRTKGCGVCRRTYDAAGWNGLAVVKTLPAESVQAHLTVPAVWAVELRRCACGAVLARRSGGT